MVGRKKQSNKQTNGLKVELTHGKSIPGPLNDPLKISHLTFEQNGIALVHGLGEEGCYTKHIFYNSWKKARPFYKIYIIVYCITLVNNVH